MNTFLNRTVGDLVRAHPSRSRIFEDLQIDYCCHGKLTLAQACAIKKIDSEAILSRLEQMEEPFEDNFNPAELSPPALADYIELKHHSYLKRELPRLHKMAEKVAEVHGDHYPKLLAIFEIFTALEQILNEHMNQEEKTLFPAVRDLTSGKEDALTQEIPMTSMIHEHEYLGVALSALHDLIDGFRLTTDACNTLHALFVGLAELEEDLHRHVHLENEVLFPAAERLFERSGKTTYPVQNSKAGTKKQALKRLPKQTVGINRSRGYS